MRQSLIGALSLTSLATTAACLEVPPPAPRVDQPSKITISTGRTPRLIAVRDGLAADWRVPTASAAGTYEIDVYGPYLVTVVCETDSGVTTQQIGRTPEDERTLDMECSDQSEPPPPALEVVGRMVQPGSITFGDETIVSADPDWEFSVRTAAGEPHDLLALTSDRIAIRRNLVFGVDTAIAPVDVVEEGTALEPAAFTAANAATGETVEAEVQLATVTSSGTVYGGEPGQARIVPSSALEATDRQSVELAASRDDAWRSVKRSHRAGDPTAFTLPDPIGGSQFRAENGEIAAGWSTLPAHDTINLAVLGAPFSDSFRAHELELSARFLTATGTTEANLDTELPGYVPEWRIDLGRDYWAFLGALHRAGGEERSSASFTFWAPESREQPRSGSRPWGDARSRLQDRRLDRR